MPEIPIPERMRHLPTDHVGHVVPWFVAFIDGKPDFRIIREDGIRDALRFHTCWLCGQRLGKYTTFLIGPMCAVNRVTAEPGSHRDCAAYAAKVCPFLTTPTMHRRENRKPDHAEPAGVMNKRNPGVSLAWTSRTWATFRTPQGGLLIDVGEPESVAWFAQGRPATRDEVLASIDSGLPILREMCDHDPDPGASRAQLAAQHARALELVPPAVTP
jgi:hypothetical protein